MPSARRSPPGRTPSAGRRAARRVLRRHDRAARVRPRPGRTALVATPIAEPPPGRLVSDAVKYSRYWPSGRPRPAPTRRRRSPTTAWSGTRRRRTSSARGRRSGTVGTLWISGVRRSPCSVEVSASDVQYRYQCRSPVRLPCSTNGSAQLSACGPSGSASERGFVYEAGLLAPDAALTAAGAAWEVAADAADNGDPAIPDAVRNIRPSAAAAAFMLRTSNSSSSSAGCSCDAAHGRRTITGPTVGLFGLQIKRLPPIHHDRRSAPECDHGAGHGRGRTRTHHARRERRRGLAATGGRMSRTRLGNNSRGLQRRRRAWGYFSHDHARTRAYRWNEDGLAGITDLRQLWCLALALWNGHDPSSKSGCSGCRPEGNHGEDVKEDCFYLDGTPTPLLEYEALPLSPAPRIHTTTCSRERPPQQHDPEFELVDTGDL